jgi:hypothetical protein
VTEVERGIGLDKCEELEGVGCGYAVNVGGSGGAIPGAI